MKNQPLHDDSTDRKPSDTDQRRKSSEDQRQDRLTDTPASILVSKLKVTVSNLQQAWTASQRSTKEDWLDWMRRFSVGLLRETPSTALRSCTALAQDYSPLVRELFNAAFVSF
jgi:FKBP12-rapamycin complex-associated protein